MRERFERLNFSSATITTSLVIRTWVEPLTTKSLHRKLLLITWLPPDFSYFSV
jgi:hypothetical protein